MAVTAMHSANRIVLRVDHGAVVSGGKELFSANRLLAVVVLPTATKLLSDPSPKRLNILLLPCRRYECCRW